MYKSAILVFCIALLASCSSTKTDLANFPELGVSLQVPSIKLESEEEISIKNSTIAEFKPAKADLTSFPEINMSLRVLSIKLVSEEEISRRSNIIAELEYEIDETDEIDFTDLIIISQFSTTQPGVTFDGNFPNSGYPKIKDNKGTVTINFPLRHVWNSHLATLKMPIEIRFHINVRLPGNRSIVIASTKTYVIEDDNITTISSNTFRAKPSTKPIVASFFKGDTLSSSLTPPL